MDMSGVCAIVLFIFVQTGDMSRMEQSGVLTLAGTNGMKIEIVRCAAGEGEIILQAGLTDAGHPEPAIRVEEKFIAAGQRITLEQIILTTGECIHPLTPEQRQIEFPAVRKKKDPLLFSPVSGASLPFVKVIYPDAASDESFSLVYGLNSFEARVHFKRQKNGYSLLEGFGFYNTSSDTDPLEFRLERAVVPVGHKK